MAGAADKPQARQEAAATFLAARGWHDAHRRPLAGDASFRRYWRLAGRQGRAVLMDAPPPWEDVRPFAAIARHLAALGLSPPRLLACDEAAGFLLLEDLGDDIFTRVLAAGRACERALYLAAIDALVEVQRAPPPATAAPYDDALFLAELALAPDWFMPLAGLALPAAGRADFFALWRRLLPLARRAGTSLVLRDYHADNLLWLPQRQGAARVGLLDFQDAVTGPAPYDLVSLLEDARRNVAAATAAAARARYLAAFAGRDADAFATACAVLGAQRNLKIVGIFCRLAVRDGKPAYLALLPRVWGHLARNLEHPALAPLAAWLARWVPTAARGALAAPARRQGKP